MSNKSEPFWYAVVSKTAPVIDRAIRREDVANEYASKCIFEGQYSGVEVVPLYTHPAPALTSELKAELIYIIESLIEMNYAPESNCSCHISPPCNDCVEYNHAREVNEHAKSAITKLTNTVVE